MVRAMLGEKLTDRKIFKDLMLGLNEIINQLTMANRVRWYGNVLRRSDVLVLRRAFDIEVEGQSKKWKQEGMNVGLIRQEALCPSVDCWH